MKLSYRLPDHLCFEVVHGLVGGLLDEKPDQTSKQHTKSISSVKNSDKISESK